MKKRLSITVSIGLLVCILGPVFAQEEISGLSITPTVKKGRFAGIDKGVSLDFDNVDIKDFVKVISQLTGKDFIMGENVRGKITVISPTKVTIEEAYKVFESVLAVNGLAAIQAGKVINIVQSRDAGRSNIRTFVSKVPVVAGDTIVTQLIPLQYIDANDMAEIVRNFLSSVGSPIPYAPTNTLILTDYASNINRILRIIRELDTDTYKQIIEVIPLQYSSAQVMAQLLTNLFQQVGGGGVSKTRAVRGPGVPPPQAAQVPTKIIAEERTNSLIVVATVEDLMAMKALIMKLDVKITGPGQIHVYYLQNADSEKLSTTLAALAGGAAPRQAGAPGAAPAAGGGVAQFEGGVKITADKSTNSLVIVSTPSDYDVLKGVITKLDIPRRQVYVEAAIVELSVDKLKELGLEFRYVNPDLKGVAGGTDFGVGMDALTMLPPSLAAIPPGLSLAQVNGIFKLDSQSFLSVGAFLHAIQTDSDANILSTPNLLAMDNESAEIIVGENVPILTSTQQVYQTGLISSPSIQRQDVGLKLKLTPQINDSDYVKLNLTTEISKVVESTGGINVNLQGVTTSKRSAQTVVVARDRQTVVIGGLLDDRVTVSESKVPILGDLPILGWLFRSSKKRVTKTNLLIFLTPYIMRGAGDMEAVRQYKEEESKSFEEESFGYIRKRRPYGSTSIPEPPSLEAPEPGESFSPIAPPESRAPTGEVLLPTAEVTKSGESPSPTAIEAPVVNIGPPGEAPLSTIKEAPVIGEGAAGEMGIILQPLVEVTGSTMTEAVPAETEPQRQPQSE